MDVDEAATRLYAMPLDQFIATRKALVAEARAAGEGDVAREVGELRKPSVAAWLVNQLARLDPAPLAGLTSLGDRLRDAQSAMRGSELKTLARERSAVVDEAMTRVSALADDRGMGLSPGVNAELHDTFVAALATAEAGAAVRSGRLVRALSYAGFGEVDLDDALAGSAPSTGGDAGTAGAAGAASGRQTEPSHTKVTERSAVEARDAERREARRRKAEEVVAARREELGDLAEQQAAAETHIGELEEKLEAAQAALVALVGKKGKAQRALREAEGALAELEEHVEGEGGAV